MDWARALATGLAQLAIWSTLLSLVPFVSLWANLKAGAFTEMPQSTLRTHWNLSMKDSCIRFYPGRNSRVSPLRA